MSLPKLICAALALAATTSCTSRDTNATYATSSPECKQAAADEEHALEKVGRTIFWLEIKLLEQSKKASSRCDAQHERSGGFPWVRSTAAATQSIISSAPDV